ncbi:MAG TPA: hypothetical protein VJO34_03810 [Methylomirabilota bacterium]|nr:hypothetical protein [Methylomirabilota bacterium]
MDISAIVLRIERSVEKAVQRRFGVWTHRKKVVESGAHWLLINTHCNGDGRISSPFGPGGGQSILANTVVNCLHQFFVVDGQRRDKELPLLIHVRNLAYEAVELETLR